jgi:hypothetical protein
MIQIVRGVVVGSSLGLAHIRPNGNAFGVFLFAAILAG